MAATIFKSDEEERRDSELAKCLQLATFYSGKSKEMCKELFLYALVSDPYLLLADVQVWVSESVSGRKKLS